MNVPPTSTPMRKVELAIGVGYTEGLTTDKSARNLPPAARTALPAYSIGFRLSDVRPWYASIAESTCRYPGQP